MCLNARVRVRVHVRVRVCVHVRRTRCSRKLRAQTWTAPAANRPLSWSAMHPQQPTFIGRGNGMRACMQCDMRMRAAAVPYTQAHITTPPTR